MLLLQNMGKQRVAGLLRLFIAHMDVTSGKELEGYESKLLFSYKLGDGERIRFSLKKMCLD